MPDSAPRVVIVEGGFGGLARGTTERPVEKPAGALRATKRFVKRSLPGGFWGVFRLRGQDTRLTGSTASINAALAAAERDGLRLHVRVRLAILAAIAVWLVVNYVP